VLVVCLAGAGLMASGACRRETARPQSQVSFRIGMGLGGTSLQSGLPVLINMLFADSLIAVGWNGRPTPRLAESWTWEDDGRTLRLFLRAGATFHDGRPVTSDEVLPVLQRALKEARNTDYFGGFAYVESVEASDDRTIVLRLSRPDAFLLNELTNTTIVASDDPNVGTGPFRIVTRVPHLEFERYGRYYRGVNAEQACAENLITPATLADLMARARRRLYRAGFEDLNLKPDHLLISFSPDDQMVLDTFAKPDFRRCNFEFVRPLPVAGD